MRQNPSFAMTDAAELRRVIDQNPWVTLVAATDDGLVASHYAVLLDDDRDDLTIVGHVGKPDDAILGLGDRELEAGESVYADPRLPGEMRRAHHALRAARGSGLRGSGSAGSAVPVGESDR